jgi:hypothetical protein
MYKQIMYNQSRSFIKRVMAFLSANLVYGQGSTKDEFGSLFFTFYQ